MACLRFRERLVVVAELRGGMCIFERRFLSTDDDDWGFRAHRLLRSFCF